MNGSVYFVTGFPGFLSKQFVERICSENKHAEVYLLHLEAEKEKAENMCKNIILKSNIEPKQLKLIQGDITREHLGLSKPVRELLHSRIHYVWHFAAVYQLAVPKKIAYNVNVVGTANMNGFVRSCKNLKRYVYFSTAYVAGTREGVLKENELVRPPGFHNFYEETKFEAELLADALKQEAPVTIIRPGIVKGHFSTGETSKFDGPYFILNMLDRLRFLPFLPYIGAADSYVNLVPFDYVIEASTYLGHAEYGEGKTYHLTDPKPYTAREIYREFSSRMLNKMPLGRIPLWGARALLQFSPLRKYLGVEKQALDYFTWGGNFDSSQASLDLEPAGISCPDFMDGLDAMVSFYQDHKANMNYHVAIR